MCVCVCVCVCVGTEGGRPVKRREEGREEGEGKGNEGKVEDERL